MFQKEGHGFVDRPRVNAVVVVQHQHDVRRQGGELVDERCQRRLDRWRLGRPERGEHALAHARSDGSKGLHQVRQEPGRFGIALVQREPRDRQPALRDPFRDQGALAEAGRRRDERQPALEPLVEPLVEAGAEDDPGSARRDVELGRQDRHCHNQMLGRGLARSTVRLHVKRASMAVANTPSNTSVEV